MFTDASGYFKREYTMQSTLDLDNLALGGHTAMASCYMRDASSPNDEDNYASTGYAFETAGFDVIE